jgi:hypothetical protein
MFEAQRVTVGELTECNERAQDIVEMVRELEVVRHCKRSLLSKNLVFVISFGGKTFYFVNKVK